MPLFKDVPILPNARILIWRTNEDVEDLQKQVHLNEWEQKHFCHFKNETRKKEFLVTRLLVQQFINPNLHIEYNSCGKPYLLNSNLNISISHTKELVAILVCHNLTPALDLEYFSERIEKIAKRFLSKQELLHICPQNKRLHMLQHWCAKECLIKLYGKKDIHLIRDLYLHPFSPKDPEFRGGIFRNDFSGVYSFWQIQFENCLLVYTLQ